MDINFSLKDKSSEIKKNVFLENLTFFRGRARVSNFFEPLSVNELKTVLEKAREENLEISIIADGTHSVISECGIDGLLISTRKLKGMTIKGNLITASAGERLNDVINTAIEHNLTALEELGGIPGTIGGALYLDAHYQNVRLSDYVFYADYMDYDGNIYRKPHYMDYFSQEGVSSGKNEIILSVSLALKPNSRTAEARKRKEDFVALQFVPPCMNMCGLVFDLDESLYSALDECASSFDSPCSIRMNSLFTFPETRASDIKEYIGKVKKEMKMKYGISVKETLSFLGKF